MPDTDIVDALPEVSSGGFEAAFSDALTGPSSPEGHPETQTASPAAAPEAPPAESSVPGPDRSPFIPRERFDEVNTRMHQAEERLRALAWAQQITPQQFQQMSSWFERAARDPLSFYTTLTEELQAHPEYGPRVRSEAARLLSSMRGASDQEPPPDYQMDDGRTFYSAEQLKAWHKWNQRQTEQSWDQRLKPLEQTKQRLEAQEQLATLTAAADRDAHATLAEVAQWPGFEDHKTAIARVFADHPEWSIERAYLAVMLPKLDATAQATVRATLQQQAVATTVNPARPLSARVAPVRRPSAEAFAEALGVGTKE